MHNRKFTVGFLMLAAIGLVGSMPSSAAALINFSLPVSACTVSGSGTPIFQWEGIYNDSTTNAMGLDCNPSAVTASGSVDSVAVYADDQSSGSVSCQMRLFDTDGDTLHTATTWNSSGTGEGSKLWNGLSTFAAANAYVYCTVPVKSGGSRSGVQSFWSSST